MDSETGHNVGERLWLNAEGRMDGHLAVGFLYVAVQHIMYVQPMWKVLDCVTNLYFLQRDSSLLKRTDFLLHCNLQYNWLESCPCPMLQEIWSQSLFPFSFF